VGARAGEAPGIFTLESAMDELAHALDVDPIQLRIINEPSDHPTAPLAGGSLGTASWGWAVAKACRALQDQLGERDVVPDKGLEATDAHWIE
jgi:xanthine dehydrogenase YagR molybdenum-binding subunit